MRPGGGITAEGMRLIKNSELTTFELYNVHADVGETTDLAKQEPKRLKRMSAALRRMYREVREESPQWPEWEFARHEGQRIIYETNARLQKKK